MKRNRIPSNSGSRIAIRYIRQVDKKTGMPIMVKNEEFNLYVDIQSYADDCNIENIIKKLGADISLLDTNKGIYIDATKLPDNYNELMNTNYKIAADYAKLPVEYKKILHNNYNLFYGLAMSGQVKNFIDSVKIGDTVKASQMLKPENFDFDKSSNNASEKGGDEVV